MRTHGCTPSASVKLSGTSLEEANSPATEQKEISCELPLPTTWSFRKISFHNHPQCSGAFPRNCANKPNLIRTFHPNPRKALTLGFVKWVYKPLPLVIQNQTFFTRNLYPHETLPCHPERQGGQILPPSDAKSVSSEHQVQLDHLAWPQSHVVVCVHRDVTIFSSLPGNGSVLAFQHNPGDVNKCGIGPELCADIAECVNGLGSSPATAKRVMKTVSPRSLHALCVCSSHKCWLPECPPVW
ncbi:uncharacterized protein WM277_000923 [Molossus nigricans]